MLRLICFLVVLNLVHSKQHLNMYNDILSGSKANIQEPPGFAPRPHRGFGFGTAEADGIERIDTAEKTLQTDLTNAMSPGLDVVEQAQGEIVDVVPSVPASSTGFENTPKHARGFGSDVGTDLNALTTGANSDLNTFGAGAGSNVDTLATGGKSGLNSFGDLNTFGDKSDSNAFGTGADDFASDVDSYSASSFQQPDIPNRGFGGALSDVPAAGFGNPDLVAGSYQEDSYKEPGHDARKYYLEDYVYQEEERGVNEPPPYAVSLTIAEGRSSASTELLFINIMDIKGVTTGESPLHGHGELMPGQKYTYKVHPERDIGPPASATVRIYGTDMVKLTKLTLELESGIGLDCVFRYQKYEHRELDEHGVVFCHFEQADFKSWVARVKTRGSGGSHSTRDGVMLDVVDKNGFHSGWISLEHGDRPFGSGEVDEFGLKLARAFTERISRVYLWKIDQEKGRPSTGTDSWLVDYVEITNTIGSQFFQFGVELDSDEDGVPYCASTQPYEPGLQPPVDSCTIKDMMVPSLISAVPVVSGL